jgi:hypothetical protein
MVRFTPSLRFCRIRRNDAAACFLKTLRPQQDASTQVQIAKREGNEQTMRILRQTAIENVAEAKNALDDVENMLDTGTYTRFIAIDFAFAIRKVPRARRGPLREVRHMRSLLANDVGFSAIGCVTPDSRFFHVQQVRQHAAIMDVGRRRYERVDDSRLAIDSDVRLHSEVPLVTCRSGLSIRQRKLLFSLHCP